MNEEIKFEENMPIFKSVVCSGCQKVIKYRHKHCPKVCPECNDAFWNKPESEYILFHLQEKYLKSRDKETLSKMYNVLKEYTKKLMIRTVKNKYFFKKDELEIKAHDAVVTIICYYLTKPEFKIENSFGGYMKIGPIKSILYAPKNEEDTDSLNILIDKENELEDIVINISEQSKLKMIVNFEEDLIDKSSTIIKEITKLTGRIQEKINKEYPKSTILYFLIGIKNRFKRLPEHFMDDFFLFCGIDVKNLIDKCMFVVYKYLKGNI